MVCYPEVQKEAQTELDNVLDGRLPEHSDIPSLPYLSALVKEVYRYAATCTLLQEFISSCLTSSRWEPVVPLGRSFFFPNMMVTSWHSWLVKGSRTSRPKMISTTTIISPPTLLWSPTNGDKSSLTVQFLSLKLHSIGRCWMTNGIILIHTYSSPNVFWRMVNSTVQLETRLILHLGSAGGEHYLFFPLVHDLLSNFMTALVEFAPGNISLIRMSHSQLRPFCQLLTCLEKWMKMVEKLSPRENILNLQLYGKYHFRCCLSCPLKCHLY